MKPCDHTEGPRHDCEYVAWRNGIAKLAAASTDAVVGATGDAAWSRKWDAAYHRTMARLTGDPLMRLAIDPKAQA